jgi:hypothetical protein
LAKAREGRTPKPAAPAAAAESRKWRRVNRWVMVGRLLAFEWLGGDGSILVRIPRPGTHKPDAPEIVQLSPD